MAENIRFDITAYDKTAQAFRSIDAKLNQTLAGAKKFEAGIKAMRGELTAFLAIGASAAAIVYLGKRFIDLGSSIGDTADKIGITAEQLQELRYAGKMAGVETETLDGAMMVFTRNLGMAQMGLGSARKALGELGFGLADIRDKSPAELFDTIADRIAKIEDPLKRNALLAQVFGRAGVQLAGMLSDGAAGLDEFREKAQRLGLVVSDEVIRKNQEAGDAFDTIGQAIEAAGMNMTAGFLPAIKTIEDIVTSEGFQQGVRDAAEGISAFIQAAVQDSDKLIKQAETIGRLVLAFEGAKLGKAGGLPGMAIGAGAGYFAPEIAGKVSNVVNLDPSQYDGSGGWSGSLMHPVPAKKKPLELTVTQPANMDEILAWREKQKRGDSGGRKVDPWNGSTIDWDAQDRTAKAIASVTKSLQDELAMLGMTDREREIYNNLLRAGADASTSAGEKIAALTGQLYDQRQAMAAAREQQDFFAGTLYSAFDDLIVQGESLEDVVANLGKALAEAALQAALLGQGPLAGILGMSGGSGSTGGLLGTLLGAVFGGFRASGGDVSPGKLYAVNEKTQKTEFFMPSTAGKIITHEDVRAAMGYSGGRGGVMAMQAPPQLVKVEVVASEDLKAHATTVATRSGAAAYEAANRSVMPTIARNRAEGGGDWRIDG